MQSIVVLLSLHIYFSILSVKRLQTWATCLPASLSFSDSFLPLYVCAVKGHTETRVHCQVIPVTCLYNGCHLAVPIISDWECVQCCFLPTYSPFKLQSPKEKCFTLKISYPWENGSSLTRLMNLPLSNNSTDHGWQHHILFLVIWILAELIHSVQHI